MQYMSYARWAGAAILGLAALVTTATPAAAASAPGPQLLADASWHGRPIQEPWRAGALAVRAEGAEAARVRPGTGFATPGGSQRVRDVQRRLRRLGYRPGRVDGLYGPRTQAAIMAFQRKHGLRRSGDVGRATMRILRIRTGPQPGARVVSDPAPTERTPSAAPPEPVAAPTAQRTSSRDDGMGTTPLVLAAAFLALVPLALLVGRRLGRGDDADVQQRVMPVAGGPEPPRIRSEGRGTGRAAGRKERVTGRGDQR